jgi:hypothetical protein
MIDFLANRFTGASSFGRTNRDQYQTIPACEAKTVIHAPSTNASQ